MSKRITSSRFLDPAKIDTAIAEVTAAAKKEHVRIALAGGCALQLHGSDRFTADVDFVANSFIANLPNKGNLSFGGTKSVTTNGVPVDIIVRSDLYQDLYDEALTAARRIAGTNIPVITLPYLGAMKMVAGRGKDEQDLKWILTDSDVSYSALRTVVKKHLGPYAADELDATRKIAAWEKKGRKS